MSKSWMLLSLFTFALVVNAGCSADSGAPSEVAELDELEQYIAENPSAAEEGSDSPIDGSD
ncbi:hypothetical protein [Novipirellula caenicola]|uniref:Secreted protein n=1 Tax=Novipirellula caenicola TaxID=1536901 RepID=A0ABP9VQ17_9BACT